jgi:hypothetical protein
MGDELAGRNTPKPRPMKRSSDVGSMTSFRRPEISEAQALMERLAVSFGKRGPKKDV